MDIIIFEMKVSLIAMLSHINLTTQLNSYFISSNTTDFECKGITECLSFNYRKRFLSCFNLKS